MKKVIFGLVAALLIASPLSAFGAVMGSGENYYLEGSSTVNDNLYVGGANVNINGIVNGDVLVGGASVFASGQTNGDLMIAGGTLNVIGAVSGDARVAGGNITITAPIGGELMVAGGQVNISGATIAKDANIAAGTLNYSGTTNGKMNIVGGQIYINGTVDKDLSIKAKEVRFGPKAVIKGNLDYYSPSAAVMDQGAVITGQNNFHKVDMPMKKEVGKGAMLGFITFAWLLKSLSIVIAAWIAIYLFKNQSEAIVNESLRNFWRNTGKGFAMLILVPVAVILSFITVIGLIPGFVVLFFYISLVILSSIIALLLFTRLAMKYIFKKEDYRLNWWIVIISAIVMGIISIIPFVGPLFNFFIFLAAFGSTTNYILSKLK